MKKQFAVGSLSLLIILGFALSACDGSGSNPGSGSGVATPQEQAQARAELVSFNAAEKDLERVALKITSDFKYQNGVSTSTYTWDKKYTETYLSSHPEISKNDMIAALKKYINEGEVAIRHWGERLIVKDEVEAKISLAQKTINALQQ